MKIRSKFRFTHKILAMGLLMFTMTGYGGFFGDLFNSNYDPYYGRDKTQSAGCYRPCVETVDRCSCAANVDQCKCLRSVTTFEQRYKDSPYSPMSDYYTNWFSGIF